ncbi:MAG TPA: thioesterase domain-containing protein [Methylocella sp.]|nr:thioesterase domain-containing protein [Methylocella sp.]
MQKFIFSQNRQQPFSLSSAGRLAKFKEMFRAPGDVIVPLNDTETGPKFFCIHSITGKVTDFVELATLLDSQVRFYGIQVPPRVRLSGYIQSIEKLAKFHAEAIKVAQPEGNVMLGGWSVGVIVALETARQLTADGRYVSLLASIDDAPLNIGLKPGALRRCARMVGNLPVWLAEKHLVDPRNLTAFVKNRSVRVWKVGKQLIAGAKDEKTRLRHPVWNYLEEHKYSPKYKAFIEEFYDLARQYKAPMDYRGPVVVYEAKTVHPVQMHQVARTWKQITPQAEIVAVRGTHESMIHMPHVVAIADDLCGRIERAATATPDVAGHSPLAPSDRERGPSPLCTPYA